MTIAQGRAFVFGDDIDTDILAPGHLMKLPAAELAKHCLEAIDPAFAASVRPGDIVVAGRNFGLGSSREQAAESLKLLGVSVVLATSFARLFYRNALNIGLVALAFPDADQVENGDLLVVDCASGHIGNRTRRTTHQVEPIPPHLLTMIDDGGLMSHLRRRGLAAGLSR